jgi:CheY-like chemotaxis protein
VNYGIIQRHGGELTIDSAEGRGTTITFRLPPEATPDQRPPSVEPQGVTPRRILLVDDDLAVRESMAEALADDGHAVTRAESGKDALAHLASGQPVDLVLTDLGMPGMTGWEVARAVKASYPAVSVGLITGWGANPKGAPEDRAAVDFVLAKPVTQETLRSCLAQLLLTQESDPPKGTR